MGYRMLRCLHLSTTKVILLLLKPLLRICTKWKHKLTKNRCHQPPALACKTEWAVMVVTKTICLQPALEIIFWSIGIHIPYEAYHRHALLYRKDIFRVLAVRPYFRKKVTKPRTDYVSSSSYGNRCFIYWYGNFQYFKRLQNCFTETQ